MHGRSGENNMVPKELFDRLVVMFNGLLFAPAMALALVDMVDVRSAVSPEGLGD